MTALSEESILTAELWPTPYPSMIELVYEGVPLSKVTLFSEDGRNVIRSIEYDVIAADEDLRGAVEKFVRHTRDYAQALSESDDASPQDVELALTIFGRLAEIATAVSRQEALRRGGVLTRLRRYAGRRSSRGFRLNPAAQL